MDTPDSVCRAQPLLGTFVEIRSAGANGSGAERAIDAAFEAIAKIHRLMSFHDGDSDVSRLNRDACKRPVVVDSWTYEVLEAALTMHRQSEGAFDITVAPVLQKFGLLPRHETDVGSSQAAAVTSEAIELLPGYRVRFHHPGVRIDLGGIAKGFAVDRAIDILQQHGQARGLVNAGGDLAAFGPLRETVHVRHPRFPNRILCQVAISNAALASSGYLFDPLDTVAGCHDNDGKSRDAGIHHRRRWGHGAGTLLHARGCADQGCHDRGRTRRDCSNAVSGQRASGARVWRRSCNIGMARWHLRCSLIADFAGVFMQRSPSSLLPGLRGWPPTN